MTDWLGPLRFCQCSARKNAERHRWLSRTESTVDLPPSLFPLFFFSNGGWLILIQSRFWFSSQFSLRSLPLIEHLYFAFWSLYGSKLHSKGHCMQFIKMVKIRNGDYLSLLPDFPVWSHIFPAERYETKRYELWCQGDTKPSPLSKPLLIYGGPNT